MIHLFNRRELLITHLKLVQGYDSQAYNYTTIWAESENAEAACKWMDVFFSKEGYLVTNYGFEGEIGPLVYEQISNGNRLSVYLDDGGFWDDEDDLFDDEDDEDDEDEAFEGHSESCEGMKFVITGKLEHFENREEMVEYIEDLGGTVSDSVSKNTHFLICNDLSSTSSKMKKAKTLCVPVITEEAFIRKFGDPDEYDLPETEDLGDDLWSVTYEGGFYETFQRIGIGSVFTRIWKKGKWVNK